MIADLDHARKLEIALREVLWREDASATDGVSALLAILIAASVDLGVTRSQLVGLVGAGYDRYQSHKRDLANSEGKP